MTKICAWDVGIKNLAFCIINKNEKGFEIDKWEVINIVEDITKPLTCCSKIKSGAICGKKAKYGGIINKEFFHYCKIHMNSHEALTDEDIENEKLDENEEVCEFNSKCTKKCTYKINNKKYCTNHKNNIIKNIIKESQLKPIKKQKKCTSLDPQLLGTKLTSALDNCVHIKDILSCDEIIIENQPPMLGFTIRHVASMLFHYFILRGVLEKDKNKTNITKVGFTSAINKLKINDDNSIQVLFSAKKENNKSKVYKLTKQLGIKYASQIFENNKMDDCIKKLSLHTKKDDLCDCFLLGYYYLYKNEL
jgi:hypothetical protein